MEYILVKPVNGAKVLKVGTDEFIKEEGELVPKLPYFTRRILLGELEEVKEKPKKEKKEEK